MRADLCDTKVILGVDRLDCIKGIPQKLHAFDRLLERRPDLIGEAVLLQVAVPSRDDLKSHQDLKEEIQHLVGKINGKHGMSSRYFLSAFRCPPACVPQTLTSAQAK
jgi:trehalose 6-phosphate synthase